MPDVVPLFDPQAERYTDQQLRDIERETDALGRGRGRAGGPGRIGGPGGGRGQAQTFTQARAQFLLDEGVLAVITPGRGTGGTGFVGGGRSRAAGAPPATPPL